MHGCVWGRAQCALERTLRIGCVSVSLTEGGGGAYVPSNAQQDVVCRLAAIARRLPAIGSGMVVAVPIPAQDEELGRELQGHINTALQEAEARHVSGAEITPYVLERVRALTGGKSLEANIRLVLNNATIGAQVAVEVAAQEHPTQSKL